MKLTEVLEKYKQLDPAKRRLILVAPGILVLVALMTAPRGTSPARDEASLTASSVSDCAVTKMHMSIFGRSLVAYDWQSGNCTVAAVRPRKVIE
jgi:hypothetical protein